MSHPLPHGSQRDLVLADGSRWVIAAGDEEAAFVVSQLTDAMQLRATSGKSAVESPHHGIVRRLLVLVDAKHDGASPATRCSAQPPAGDDPVVCVLRSFTRSNGQYVSDGLYVQLVELSQIIARDAQTRGGVLLHGALAEKDGIGVILAAPGGTGKTTASARLLAPWRSLCDDATLVVRDSRGDCWAHPWPTWSRFQRGEPGGTWDVQKAVPLRGIFFLSRAAEDRAEPVGPGHAVSLLVECAAQASQLMTQDLGEEETRALQLERFDSLCALAHAVPAHTLHISLTGAFWQEIEQALEASHLSTGSR